MNTQRESPLLCPSFSSYATDRLDHYKSFNRQEDNDDDLFEFPVFNRESFTDKQLEKLDDSVVVVPLKNLFMEEERENRISTSSDESDSEAPEPYCMWRRKSIGSAPSPTDCHKSKSTGSILFKRFKICDLLRSSSDGKESYLFSAKIDKSSSKIDYRKSPGRVTGKVKAAPASSAHELFYVQNRSIKEGDKRKSYLPYRKDLIGFFSVLGRASRT